MARLLEGGNKRASGGLCGHFWALLLVYVSRGRWYYVRAASSHRQQWSICISSSLTYTYASAIHSISTGTPFGSCFTATQLLAGFSVKCCAYTPFISAKSPMSVRKTLTFTTLSMEEPAAFRMALMLLMQVSVFWAMLPSTSVPVVSAGIWPETKMKGGAETAWD